MKLFLCFLVLISLLSAKFTAGNISKFVEPIKTLLHEITEPLKITAMVCWSSNQRLKFTQSFHNIQKDEKDYMFSIVDTKTSVFPINVQDQHRHIVLTDVRCPESSILYEKINEKIFRRFKWLIIDSSLKMNENAFDKAVKGQFEKIAILPSSEIYYMLQGENGFVIKQVYRPSLSSDLIYENFGAVTNGRFFDFRQSRITARRRQNLKGINLRASIVITNNNSLNHLTDYRDKHIDTITKVNYILTTYLVSYVNANLSFTVVKSWGYKDNRTENWSGMIGELIDDDADIGATALFYTTDRIPFIDYIHMPSASRSKFVFRSPKLSYTDNVFILPFDKLVWYCLIGLIVVATVSLTVATTVEWRLQTSPEIYDPGRLQASLKDNLLLVFGAICQQGSSVSPKRPAGRIIMMISFTILMFLYTSYSANIVALLQSPSMKIKTLEDLLNSRLQFGADDTVFNRYYFSHATEPIRKSIYEQKIMQKDGKPNYFPLDEGVRRIREGLFAFNMELGVGYKVISETFLEYEKCGLQEIQYLQVIDPWYAIQKNSSYKELFKTGMIRLKEHGLQDRENSKLYTKKPKCSGGGANFITASLLDVRAAIIILLWGILLAVLVLIMECLLHRYKLKRNLL